MIIYAVTAGSWDSFHYEAVFSTKDLAKQYIAAQGPREYDFENVNPEPVAWIVHDSVESAAR